MTFVDVTASLSAYGIAGLLLVFAAEHEERFVRTGLVGAAAVFVVVALALTARGCA